MANNNTQLINSYWNAQNYNNNTYNIDRKTSIEEAIIIAKERVPGEVIKVELDIENGLFVYEVRIRLAQGIIYELEIDVSTGQIVQLICA